MPPLDSHGQTVTEVALILGAAALIAVALLALFGGQINSVLSTGSGTI